jgi:quercetin dioxygenase-like cupin family protein
MAHQGQVISNARTGQRMTFVDLSERELRIETVNPPSDEHEPLHVHPHQESGCEVVSGTLVWEVNGAQRSLSAGETITVPADTPHRFWNDGPDEARATQVLRPALNTAEFFEALFELAQRGELDSRGIPKLLPLSTMVRDFGEVIRPVSPPWPVLRALAAVLAPIARSRGY